MSRRVNLDWETGAAQAPGQNAGFVYEQTAE